MRYLNKYENPCDQDPQPVVADVPAARAESKIWAFLGSESEMESDTAFMSCVGE